MLKRLATARNVSYILTVECCRVMVIAIEGPGWLEFLCESHSNITANTANSLHGLARHRQSSAIIFEFTVA